MHKLTEGSHNTSAWRQDVRWATTTNYVTEVLKIFKRLAYYRNVLKSVALIIFIIATFILTINPYLFPPQVESTPESSSPSSDENDDGNDNNGSGSQDNSPQDDSEGTDSSSDGSGGDDNNDNGFGESDERNLIANGKGAGAEGEPPTSTERRVQQIIGQ